MEIKYFQTKEESGKTVQQEVVLVSEKKQTEEENRKSLVELLSSFEGISLPIEISINDQKETHNFVFHHDGDFDNANPNMNGGYLTISNPAGEEIGSISYVLTQGRTSSEPTAFITDKSYVGIGKDIYGNLGVMKISFSFLAEVLKEHGIKKVEAFITGGKAAENSRVNAPKIFGSGTYADSSEEVEVDSVDRQDTKDKILVTSL